MWPPNTRVQRTRSSPSALRSPLTRHPLGSAKQLIAFCTIVSVLAGGCASARQNTRLSLTIVDAAGGYPITGVEIVVTDKATAKVSRATTDSQGRVSFAGLAAGHYSLAAPALGPTEDLFIPDHIEYRGGSQDVQVKADLTTDKKGWYVGPGAA